MTKVALVLLLSAVGIHAKLEDFVKVNGEKRKLTSGCHKLMCKAVVSEMREEIQKHDLTKEGEGDVFDTAGQAICIGVVQHYMMYERKGDRWSIRKRHSYELSDDHTPDFNALLTLKESCFHFCDETQLELSEYTYNNIHNDDGDTAFCEQLTKPKAKKKKTKSKKTSQPPQDEQKYDDMMNKIGQDLNIQDLMQTDRYSPELLLDDADQEYIKTGIRKMTCKICRTAIKKAYKDTTPITDEAKLSAEVEAAFFGKDDVESMDYVPASPPSWALGYVVSPKFELQRMDPDGEPLQYNENIIRNVIISKAARRAHEMANIDIAEHIIQTAKSTGRKPTSHDITNYVCSKPCASHPTHTEEL